jgi:pimeloyl-ACP methyl ester carboxylesterase
MREQLIPARVASTPIRIALTFNPCRGFIHRVVDEMDGAPMQNLVLIPGLGSDSTVWTRTIAELKGEVNSLVGDTLRDDSLATMAQRILENAPPQFALAGVSMGGMVALEVMRIAPERVTRLALVDTLARPDTFAQKAYRNLANLVVAAFDYRRLSEFSMRSLVHPSAALDIRSELIEMGVAVGWKTYIRQNRAVLARADQRPILGRIAIPTTVVVGAQDRMTPLKLSEEIRKLIPGSTLQILDGCGHLPPIEKPEAMARILLDLIRKNSSDF